MFENLEVTAFLIGLAVYLAPAIEAKARRREDAWTIALVNLFLGWTVIGWFAAFMLARRRISERRLSTVASRARREAARSTIARIVAHAHDCRLFERAGAKVACMQ
jgi:hypothetical protein